MYTSKPLSGQKGMALALTLFFLLILVMTGSLFFITSQTELQHGSSYTRRIEALSVAESAAERALWALGTSVGTQSWSAIYPPDEWNTNFGGDTKFIKVASDQYMRVSYPETVFYGTNTDGTHYANLKIIATGMLGREENGQVIPISTKKIEIIVKVNRIVGIDMPNVFDYAYFINNWGWWYYGGGEQVRGSMRSNGRFDFEKYSGTLLPWSPSKTVRVDGNIEAHSNVRYGVHRRYGLCTASVYLLDGLAGLKKTPDYATCPYKKSNLQKENIPNLQNMDYYKKIARGFNPDTNRYDHATGTIKIGTRTFTSDGVFGDKNNNESPHENLILIGTNDAPIEITDSVVIEGHLIIKGVVKVTGSNPKYPQYGSIYVGGNVYIAGNIQYNDGPNWSTSITTSTSPVYPLWQQSAGTDYMNPASSTFNIANDDDCLPSKSCSSLMDRWVGSNSTKSLLSVSAKGGLVYGNYSSANWYADAYLFDNPKKGTKGMGSEDVGADGIPNTGDAGEGDGKFQPATEDLDGDGEFRRDNYTWKDVSTTGGNSSESKPLNNFAGLGRIGNDQGRLWDPIEKKYITHYGDTATNMISTIDGVYYTQHFLAGRVANSPAFRGSLISKDEAIVYSGVLSLIQDTRYHSNYRNDPNFPIYLFPPGTVPLDEGSAVLGVLQRVLSWKEVQ